MNWTGGGLQRHSKANKNVAARQKQHFARVQQQMRNGSQKNSPAKFTIFGKLVQEKKHGHQELSAAESSRHISRERSRGRSHSLQPRLDLLPSKQNTQHTHPRKASPSYKPARRHYTPAIVKREPDLFPEEDLYNATPAPRAPRQYVEEEEDTVSEEIIHERGESIVEKRRRILDKGDWVGITIQQPLGYKFTSPSREENVGKRRRITEGHRARYNARQGRITSPFQKLKGPRANTRFEDHEQHLLNTRRAGVKISIGGKVIPPGVNSSSAQHNRRERSLSLATPGRMSIASQVTSSDVMLLGNGDTPMKLVPETSHNSIAGRFHNSDRSLPYNRSHHITSESKVSGMIEYEGNEEYPEDFETGEGEASYEWAGFESTGKEMSQSRSRQEKLRKRRRSPGARRNPTSLDRLEITNTAFKSRSPGHVFFSSSSASLQHPAPKRPKVSSLVRSDSSDLAVSTVAQVGKASPVITRSPSLNEEIYQRLIAPAYKDEMQQGSEAGQRCDASISPGVSTTAAVRCRNKLPSDDDEDDSFEAEITEKSEKSVENPTSGPGSERSSSVGQGIIWGKKESSQEPVSDNHGSPIFNQHSHFQGPVVPSKVDYPPPKLQPLAMDKDEDEIWRKFVFGDSSDEVDVLQADSRHNVQGDFDETESPSSTSMIALANSKDSASSANEGVTTRETRLTESLAATHQPYTPKKTAYRKAVSSVGSPNWNISASRPPGAQASIESTKYSTSDSASSSAPLPPPSPSAASGLAVRGTPYKQPRKAIFTKPKPFIGIRSTQEQLVEEEPLHIGRGLRDKGTDHNTKKGFKRERDVYSLVDSEEQSRMEDVESIEDD